jgi:putative tricarboxylic transport membrane protein
MRIDYVVAGVTACLAAGYLAGVSAIPRLMIGDPLGPRAFPILIGIGLLVAAVLLVLETRRAARAGQSSGAALPPFDRRLMVLIAAIVVLLLCFEPLGYVVSVGLFLLAMTMYLNRGHWVANVVTSVSFTLITAYVFNHYLDVRLPAGVLGI